MKRNFILSIFAALTAVLSGGSNAFAITLSTGNVNMNVFVKDQATLAPIARAQVIAVYFGPNGPDQHFSQVAITDNNGLAQFSTAAFAANGNLPNALFDAGSFPAGAPNGYEITAASAGFLPSVRDSLGSNGQNDVHLAATAPLMPAITVFISSAGGGPANNYGEIDADFQNATASTTLFGNVNLSGANSLGITAFCAGRVRGNGTGRMFCADIPFAGAFTYGLGAFDQFLNKNVGTQVSQDLSNASPSILLNGPQAFDFATQALPPPTNVNSGGNASGSGLSVDGVVEDSTTAQSPIPYTNINLVGVYTDQYNNTRTDYRWANADQNGRFQLYGLIQGATYYPTVYGTCDFNGNCYSGYSSTAAAKISNGQGGYACTQPCPVGAGDFLFDGAPLSGFAIKLNRAPRGNGQFGLYVKDNQGNPIPQAWVNVYQDGNGWLAGGPSCTGCNSQFTPGCMQNNPGLANINTNATTGYALISGLQPGNYRIQAGTPFGQGQQYSLNDGADGKSCWSSGGMASPNSNPCGCGTDDLRFTVFPSSFAVFDSSGNALGANQLAAMGLPGISSTTGNVTITVTLSNVGLNGVVQGTLSFPPNLTYPIDLSADPINITLWPQCSPGSQCPGGGGFKSIGGTLTASTASYSIQVSSGQAYWMNVNANYWGQVQGGGGQNQVDLTVSTSATVNLQFQRAGRVTGKLYKPDGSLFIPTNGGTTFSGADINANCSGSGGCNSYGFGQVQQDGSFAVTGLIPGTYNLNANGYGAGFSYITKQPLPTVAVTAGNDTYQDVNLTNSVSLQVNVSTALLPPFRYFTGCPPNFAGECPPEGWVIKSLPQGGVFDQASIRKILVNDHENGSVNFEFNTSSSSFNCRCQGGCPAPVGFCVNPVQSPAVFDLYVMMEGGFDSAGFTGARPYFVIESSTKNIAAKSSLGVPVFNPMQMSTATVEFVPANPAGDLSKTSTAAFTGAVSGNNIFRASDFASLGGNFNNFIKYVPIMSLYDSNNALKAAGLAVPNPTRFSQPAGAIPGCGAPGVITIDDCMNYAITQGNFNLFQTIFSTAGGLAYEIRGLSTGTYNAVLTTPNYPPYTAVVTINQSTVTLNVNFDTAVGVGATISGVIASTASVAIPNAVVNIKADNYPQKGTTSDSSGNYSFPGLAGGTFRVTVSAPNYAIATALVGVSGTASAAGSTITQSFTGTTGLVLGAASIQGAVFAQIFGSTTPVSVQSAAIYAYNDTQNINNPTADLALFKTATSSAGYYTLDGLQAGATYQVFAKIPGYFKKNVATMTIAGVQPNVNFTFTSLERKPITINVYTKLNAPNGTFDFTVLNPDAFTQGSAWISTAPFPGKTLATNVGNMFQKISADGKSQLLLRYPLSNLTPGITYVLHGEAFSPALNGSVTREVNFGIGIGGDTVQDIDDLLFGDITTDSSGRAQNLAVFDPGGSDATGASFPTGALTTASTGTAPGCEITSTDPSSSTLPSPTRLRGMSVEAVGFHPSATASSTAAYAGNIYSVVLSSINYNVASGTGKGVTISLHYNSCPDITDCAVYHFDTGSGLWAMVPGTQTIDPVKQTITIPGIQSLASVTGLRAGHPMLASVQAGRFVPSVACATCTTDTGTFAVLHPSLVISTAAPTSVTAIKIYNFPNPFDLSLKTVTAVAGSLGAQTIYGTMIKIEIPAGIAGTGQIRIYSIAGELVRELDPFVTTGQQIFYEQWDGKNKSGAPVANGVYYGVLSIPGVKAKDGTFKLAVIK